MLVDEVCKELEVSKTTLNGYINRGIIAKPSKIKNKGTCEINSWSVAQVQQAKLNQAAQGNTNRIPPRRTDHTPTEETSSLIYDIFGIK